MAEVYGSIGDQPVELNNAASEATLKQLLAIANAQYKQQIDKKRGGAAKEQADLTKQLKELAKAAELNKKQYIAMNKELVRQTALIKENTEAVEEEKKEKKKTTLAVKKFAGAVNTSIVRMSNLTSALSNMGNSISAATNILSSIPIVGQALAASLGAIAQAVERTQKSFMQTASVGANFGGSISDMVRHATEAGLTIDQFSSIIANSGESLAFLASSTSEGAKRLSGLAVVMKNSGLQDNLAYLGFSLEDINSGMLAYSGILAKAGVNVKAMANEELVNLTYDYMRNLDAVSKLTGLSRKDIEKQRQERQRESKFRILERRAGNEGVRNRLNTMMDIVGPGISAGLRDLLLNMDMGEEAQALLNFQGPAAQYALELGQKLQRGGTLTEKELDNLLKQLTDGAKQISNSELVNILGGPLAAKYGQFVVDNMNLERLRGKSVQEQQKIIDEEIKKKKEAAEAADPAKLMRVQADLAKSANAITQELLKYTPILLKTMEGMNSIIQKFIVPSLGKLADIGEGIFNFMVDAVDYFRDLADSIGQKIGQGLIKILPKGLVDYFSDNDEAPTTPGGMLKKSSELSAKITQNNKSLEDLNKALSGNKLNDEQRKRRTEERDRLLRENETLRTEINNLDSARRAAAASTTPSHSGALIQAEQDEMYNSAVDPLVMATLALEGKMNDVDGTFVESIETTQALLDNVDKLTKETKNLTNETRNASSCELDYSNPQALFNSFAKIMVGGATGSRTTGAISGTTAAAPGTAPGTAPGVPGGAFIPTQGKVSSEYGMRTRNGRTQMHTGIDIAAAEGTAVLAPEGGTARLKTEIDKATGKMKGYGKYIEIVNDQGEVIHRLAHLSEKIVKEGERVVAGQVIGKVGNTGESTGPHLHWETLRGGRHYDPREFMARATGQPGTATPRPAVAGGTTPTAQQAATMAAPVTAGGGTTPAQPGAGAPMANQASPMTGVQDQLQTLNTTVAQLLTTNKESYDVIRKQLVALQSMTGNAFPG